METKANYVVVGVFTLFVILACFGFILWIGGYSKDGDFDTLKVNITGSVIGLSEGSPVYFNGVKVGSVDKIQLDEDQPDLVVAYASVNSLTPIRADTKANIGVQGLTGGATIELSGGSKNAVRLLQAAEEKGEIAAIQARPSAVSDLLTTAQSIAERIDGILISFETIVGNNEDAVNGTLQNIDKITKIIAENEDNIESFLKGAGAVANTFNSLSEKIDGTMEAVEGIFNAVDPDNISAIISNVTDFSGKLSATNDVLNKALEGVEDVVAAIKPDDIGEIVDNVKQLSGDLSNVSSNLEDTLGKVDGVLDAVDKEKIAESLDNIAKATETAKQAIDSVAKTANVIGDGNEDVKDIIKNVSAMTERLNKASSKVESVLVSLDGLLGSDETKGVVSDAQSTITEYRKLAQQLQSKVDTISTSLNRGIGGVKDLVDSSKRSIQRIERSITTLGDDPSKILGGGGSSVREYNGRPRR